MSIPFDAIVSFLIFLIGLPAILLQTLPSEIRKVVLKQHGRLIFYTFIPFAVAISVVSTGIGLSIFSTQIASAYPQMSQLLTMITAHDGNLLWTIVIITLLMIAGVAAAFFIRKLGREAVITQLAGSAAKGVSRQGRPIESKLKTLIQLGKQSQSGQDKGLALEALTSLAEKTQIRDDYNGAQLEDLIIGLEEVLILGPHKGSLENFHTAADLLADIIISASDKSNSDDLKLAIQTVSMLGRTSLGYEPSHVQTKFIDALALANQVQKAAATWMSQALFEIGRVAAEHNQILVAMAALSRLESLAMQHQPISGELAADFIGLLAHFRMQGETAKSYAKPILDDAPMFFTQPLPEVIRDAQVHCRETANFKTSDHLAEMLREMTS